MSRMINIVKRNILFVILVVGLVACGEAAPAESIYETVSVASLNPGDSLPAPNDEVVLRVTGKIGQTNAADAAEFDLAMLESIGQVQYDVHDPFAKVDRVFTGPLLAQLLSVVGAASDATTLEFIALNDYKVEMDIKEASKWPVLYALQADGQYIPLDDGGPAKIVFPFDDYEELDQPTYGKFWVWSMAEIVVK